MTPGISHVTYACPLFGTVGVVLGNVAHSVHYNTKNIENVHSVSGREMKLLTSQIVKLLTEL